MAIHSFALQEGVTNTFSVPVRTDGKTVTSATLYVCRRDGSGRVAVPDATVTVTGRQAIIVIPAARSTTEWVKGRWEVILGGSDGSTWLAAAGNSAIKHDNADRVIVNNASPIRVQNFEAQTRTVLPREHHVMGGRAFAGSTGVLSAGAVGTTHFKGTLTNPAGSGKTLYLYRLSTYSSATAADVALLINPTTALPTTSRPINNNYIGYPMASVAQLRVDAGVQAMSGGTDSGIRVPVVAAQPEQIELPPYIIPPGVTLGLAGPFGAATNLVVTIYWAEV